MATTAAPAWLGTKNPWRAAATFRFAAIVTGWIAFLVLALASEPALGDLWRTVRDLPLVLEALVWFALFPFVLALGVWDADWDQWLRTVLVACFAIGWSLAFLPRAR